MTSRTVEQWVFWGKAGHVAILALLVSLAAEVLGTNEELRVLQDDPGRDRSER